jgi:hypothetical protein
MHSEDLYKPRVKMRISIILHVYVWTNPGQACGTIKPGNKTFHASSVDVSLSRLKELAEVHTPTHEHVAVVHHRIGPVILRDHHMGLNMQRGVTSSMFVLTMLYIGCIIENMASMGGPGHYTISSTSSPTIWTAESTQLKCSFV